MNRLIVKIYNLRETIKDWYGMSAHPYIFQIFSGGDNILVLMSTISLCTLRHTWHNGLGKFHIMCCFHFPLFFFFNKLRRAVCHFIKKKKYKERQDKTCQPQVQTAAKNIASYTR
jgi:hypothetical protein